jgi:hypothetical protein
MINKPLNKYLSDLDINFKYPYWFSHLLRQKKIVLMYTDSSISKVLDYSLYSGNSYSEISELFNNIITKDIPIEDDDSSDEEDISHYCIYIVDSESNNIFGFARITIHEDYINLKDITSISSEESISKIKKNIGSDLMGAILLYGLSCICLCRKLRYFIFDDHSKNKNHSDSWYETEFGIKDTKSENIRDLDFSTTPTKEYFYKKTPSTFIKPPYMYTNKADSFKKDRDYLKVNRSKLIKFDDYKDIVDESINLIKIDSDNYIKAMSINDLLLVNNMLFPEFTKESFKKLFIHYSS